MPLNNKYIYFSSEGDKNNPKGKQNANSDFQINFADPLVLEPYTQVRLVNCAIDTEQLTVVIDESNDTIGWSVGFPWYDPGDPAGALTTNGFSFQRARLEHGVYLVGAGDGETDPLNYLAPQIEQALNNSCSNLANLRGGFTVTIDANSIINIKLSSMTENYVIPSGATNLPDDFLNKVIEPLNPDRYSIARNPATGGYPIARYAEAMNVLPEELPLRTGDATVYRGLTLTTDANRRQYNDFLNGDNGDRCFYFNTPPLAMRGDFDSTSEALIAKVYLNLNDIHWDGQAERHFTAFGDAGDYINISIVSDLAALIPTTRNSCQKYTGINYPPVPVSNFDTSVFKGELARFLISYDRDNDEATATIYCRNLTANGIFEWEEVQDDQVNLNDRIYFELYSKGPTVNSFQYKIKIYRAENADATNFSSILDTGFRNYFADGLLDEIVDAQREQISPNNVGFAPSMRLQLCSTYFPEDSGNPAKTNFEDAGNLLCAFNFDPQGGQYGFYAGAFQAAGSLTKANANLGNMLPLVVYGDSRLAGDQEALNYVANSLTPPGKPNLDWSEQIPNLANIGANFGNQFFGEGRLSNIFIAGGSTHTAGATAKEAIENTSTPQLFFDLPDLPLNNKTGNQLFGRNNNFIAPVLLPSQTNSALRPDVSLYNNLENSYPMRITNLRIRICELDGTPAQNLIDFTSGCLEFRDNPEYKREIQARENAQMVAKQLNESYTAMLQQLKPFGPQKQ